MSENENPLHEVTPPILEEPIKEVAQTGVHATEALEAALTLHRQKTVSELRAVLEDGLLGVPKAVAEEIRKQLNEVTEAVEEAPALVSGASESGGSQESTVLEMEKPAKRVTKVARKASLIHLRR